MSVEHLKYTDEQINQAVRTLLDVLEDDPSFILLADREKHVYIVPALLTETSTDDPSNVGKIEYQVSDGPPGKRGTGCSYYVLADAIAFYNRVRNEGWRKATHSMSELEIQRPGKPRGWVFTKEGNPKKEIGFAEPQEYENADAAVHGFKGQEAGDFDVYFRDSHGILNSVADEDRAEDFH